MGVFMSDLLRVDASVPTHGDVCDTARVCMFRYALEHGAPLYNLLRSDLLRHTSDVTLLQHVRESDASLACYDSTAYAFALEYGTLEALQEVHAHCGNVSTIKTEPLLARREVFLAQCRYVDTRRLCDVWREQQRAAVHAKHEWLRTLAQST